MLFKLSLVAAMFGPMIFANASTASKNANEDKFYNNLVLGIPSTMYVFSNMVGLAQIMMVQNEQLNAKEALDTADPNFALCMQKAIDSKFYQPAFDDGYHTYMSTVSPQDFEQDKLFINHPVTTFNNDIYKNVFIELAQNETKEQNYRLFAKLREQTKEYDENTLPDEISKTYYQNFGEKSAFVTIVGLQIQQCQISQSGNKAFIRN